MLFDIHEDPVDGKKTKRAKGDRAPAEQPPPVIPAFRPATIAVCEPLGQIEGVFPCVYQRCQSDIHEILDEHGGSWRIECMFCGTGQRVRAIKGHLKPRTTEFTFHAGDYAGLTISAVAGDPRGAAYIEWAAEEHASPAVRDACKSFLDSRNSGL